MAAHLAAVFLFLLLSVASAVDFNIPAVFNFGDSNSDTGDLIAAGIGDPLLPPNGQTYFSRPAGRFCDGRLIIDFLMEAMDMPLLNAYFNSLGAPSFQKGCNFAAAGSAILPATAASVSPFSFAIQIAQFFHLKNEALHMLGKERLVSRMISKIYQNKGYGVIFSEVSCEIPNATPIGDACTVATTQLDASNEFMWKQLYCPRALDILFLSLWVVRDCLSIFKMVLQFSLIIWKNKNCNFDLTGQKFKKYVPHKNYFSQGLYMFDIGQNDLAGAFYSKTEDQILASIPTILSEFESGLKKLYDQGARRFWIHNTGPLGCLTQNIARFGKDPSKLDETGCLRSHNRVAKLFNLQLHALCTKLQGLFEDASLTYVDVFSIKLNLIANYSKYGFENSIAACCGYGGPPLNYDSRISCGQTKVLNGFSQTAKACDDATAYIIWDGIHYSEAANLHVASQILTGKYSDPPFAEKMPFALKLRF
ncbi:hypothetical protein ZIOFF_022868 [Zingiber officinale]|uniref:GDSL esterase/lipase n=1 Tax=Zingiber officinale TaxID=94328 RepID=A0A8J5HAA7_ZINOF|nr:hypothetical protein ZIOFF_022868 [Zingiber officinale]